MKNKKFVVLATALSLIFASCDNNNGLENKEVSGREVPVRIRSMSIVEGHSENLNRSAFQKEPEMVSQPIGSAILLEMNVEQDESPLRGLVELATGTKFRVIAVESGSTKYYSHGDYEYGVGLSPLTDFHVEVGKTYDYICISYNTAALPSAGYTVGQPLPALSVDNTKDLLWYKIEEEDPVSASGVDLDIKLEQKVTRIKIKIDCDYNKWKITDVANDKINIGSVAISGTMDWSTGAVTAGLEDNRNFTFPILPDTTSQTSNELIIMPKESGTITINVLDGAISRDELASVPVGDKAATLTTALSPGTSYTLHLRFRRPVFARSNIYSTGYILTFQQAAANPADNNNTMQAYQGVFFTFGSLYGVAPVGTGSWLPNGVTVTSAISYWRATYGEIDDSRIANGLGDVCNRINANYRLPRPEEFGTKEDWELAPSYSAVTMGETTDGIRGLGRLFDYSNPTARYVKSAVLDDLYLPFSGYRRGTQTADYVGRQAIYGTSTFFQRNGYPYVFVASSINVLEIFVPGELDTVSYEWKLPVRCVKK